MTALADIDGALRTPGLTPLDRGRLLAARKQAFAQLQNGRPDAPNEPASMSPPPRGT